MITLKKLQLAFVSKWISTEKENQKLFSKHRKQSSFDCFLDRCEICSPAVSDEQEHPLSPRRNAKIKIFYKHTWRSQTDLWRLSRRKTILESDRHETIVSEIASQPRVTASRSSLTRIERLMTIKQHETSLWLTETLSKHIL